MPMRGGVDIEGLLLAHVLIVEADAGLAQRRHDAALDAAHQQRRIEPGVARQQA
jgi:hypothetical protein